MIDALLVLGVAVILPLALGGPLRWWAASAAGVALSLALPVGVGAALLVAPWVATAGSALLVRRDLAALNGLVAATSLVASRLGWSAFGIEEPIVQLTAVHYVYAGAAATVLATRAARRGGALARPAVLLTGGAPPVIALGFVLDHPLPQVGGAVLLTLGVWATAAQQVAEWRGGGSNLLLVSSLAVVAPMALAVAWAAAQHWAVPALSVPDMARVHGTLNAVGFAGAGLLARRVVTR